MVTIRTTALIMAMSVVGAVAPGAFAQNTNIVIDDNLISQENTIEQTQVTINSAVAGNVSEGQNNLVAGNSVTTLSFQNQSAIADNNVDDNDDFNTVQVDVCAILTIVGIGC